MFAVRRHLTAPLVVVLGILAAALPGRAQDEPKTGEAKPAKGESGDAVVAKESRAGAGAPRASRVSISLDGKTVGCREQAAQPFLVRGNWFPKSKDPEQIKQGRKWLEDAIRYRTEKYGYFEGFGNAKWNAHPPRHYAKSTSFMGMNVTVHERVIPALKCVEAALKASGAGDEYHPRAMGGIRFKNTYRGVEVSNHVYGIAVDIEPDKNTCCGCVAPWNTHPLCKKKVASIYERMAMPRSWVETFERFGFYWLGHDVLADTMHFEFLGDPDRIVD